MDPALSANASQVDALQAMTTALRALKAAKEEGADVKPYRQRMKDCARSFMAGDYPAAATKASQILEEVAALPRRR